MQRISQHNPEYMQVVAEVVCCLIEQLHHPQLSPASAEEIVAWFHQVNQDEVELAVESLRMQKRLPDGAQKTQK